MYLCFERSPAIQCFHTEVNRRLIFCKLTVNFVSLRVRHLMRLLSEVKCLQAQFCCCWPLTYCRNMQTRRLSVFGVASGCTWVLQNVVPPQQKKKKFESSEQSSKYEQAQRKRAWEWQWCWGCKWRGKRRWRTTRWKFDQEVLGI